MYGSSYILFIYLFINSMLHYHQLGVIVYNCFDVNIN
jgi:hypothetical protein